MPSSDAPLPEGTLALTNILVVLGSSAIDQREQQATTPPSLSPISRPAGDSQSDLHKNAARRNRQSRGSAKSEPFRSSDASDSEATRCGNQIRPEPFDLPTTAKETTRYIPVGELGRGGCGVVERSLDRQLQREVAVKRLSVQASNQPSIQSRFMHEAKVTGQLQHPSIVAVHELGNDSSGRPYYVMNLLEGDSLREHIRSAHGAVASTNLESVQLKQNSRTRHALRQIYLPLLDRFVDVCNAVAYAHRRGVIHRDLKPSNVMVGEFGETVVVDWGLAKLLGVEASTAKSEFCDTSENSSPTAEGIPTNELSDAPEPPNASKSGWVARKLEHSTSTDDYDKTTLGAVVGTPAYMPPEQANGQLELLNERSDIYSLGVMLFEMVSGATPLAGLSPEQTLERVRRGDLPGLRDVEPGAPRALAAICCKAMAVRQADRYASAEQLAEDVRRFVVGESVSACRDPLGERLMRWCRRHQTFAFAIVACLCVTVLGSLVFGAVIRNAHLSEQWARYEAEAAHREALRSLAQARESADAWLVELSGALQPYQGLEQVRRDLIQRAFSDYHELAEQGLQKFLHGTKDVRTIAQYQLEVARAWIRAADLIRLSPELSRDLIGAIGSPFADFDQSEDSANLGSDFAVRAAGTYYRHASDKLNELCRQMNLHSEHATDQMLLDHVRLEQVNAHIGQLLLGLAPDQRNPAEVWLLAQVPRACREALWNADYAAGQISNADANGMAEVARWKVSEPLREKAISAYARLHAARGSCSLRSADERMEALKSATAAARWLAFRFSTSTAYKLSQTCLNDLMQLCESIGDAKQSSEVNEQKIRDQVAWQS